MSMVQIITSILDTDKYKITMMQEIYFNINGYRKVKWKFTNRTITDKVDFKKYNPRVIKELKNQLKMMDGLSATERELKFLQSKRFHKEVIITDEFIEYLRDYKLNSSNVIFDANGDIWIEGSWVETTIWETYLLSMYNEIFTDLYAKDNGINIVENNYQNIMNKVRMIYLNDTYNFPITEFGTRRRASKDIQLFNIKQLKKLKNFQGTSNMYFAMLLDIDCIGTMAHEEFMATAAFDFVDGISVKKSQQKTLIRWDEFYKGALNIFLSDTFGTDSFLRDYKETGLYKNVKNGVRHDSGDPIKFALKMKAFYEANGIDPATRPLVFSDGLTIEKCKKIYDTVKDYCIPSFGVGTSLTNDCGGFPLSIVCKLSYVWDDDTNTWVSTVKLSDNANKATGEVPMVRYMKEMVGYVNVETNNETLVY